MSAPKAYLGYGLATAVAIVLVVGVVEIGPRLFGSCRSSPGAGRELAALQAEPILSFSAPGARADGTTSNESKDCNTMGENTSEPAAVSQRFSLAGDPPTAIEAYVAGEFTVLSLRDASTIAPAVYADRRLPTPPPGGDRLFLVAGDASLGRSGVWIDSGRGPVLLEMATETDVAVTALAKLVQNRAA